jgi:7,8-dihydropterin-6-yl-methyl-4-(beta-D-ribofuranosyl)aminobenzene 5'-phosphate synthase
LTAAVNVLRSSGNDEGDGQASARAVWARHGHHDGHRRRPGRHLGDSRRSAGRNPDLDRRRRRLERWLRDCRVRAASPRRLAGFACLVEGHGRTVLFDTGTKPEVLRRNMAALKVDAARIQALVFSHPHADHTLGTGALPALPGLPVYAGEHFRLPPDAEAQLARIGATRVTIPAATPVEVFPGFTVTGGMAAANTYEEAFVIDTREGAVVLVGCAHPGIVTMLQRVAKTTKRPIHMVLGGFHLLQTPAHEVRRIIAEFKVMGVAWAGPAHCTGEEAIALFREACGDRFIAGGVGTLVEVPRAGTRAR